MLPQGAYLDAGREGQILLPRKYIPSGALIGDELEVFIYLDNEGRPVATTSKAYAQLGDFACLRVAEVNDTGAFLDWGVSKHLMVPFREQKQKMEEGRSYVVKVLLDPVTNRLLASSRIEKHLSKEAPDCKEGEEVDVLVYAKTDMGYKAIVKNRWEGLFYISEVFGGIRVGQRFNAWVKKVREDNKIDLIQHKPGYEKVGDIAEQVFEKLKAAGGYMPYSDDSSPGQIAAAFGISKKTFKKAIGDLFRKQRILIEDEGIRIPDSD